MFIFCFINATAPTIIYTYGPILSLHHALPISVVAPDDERRSLFQPYRDMPQKPEVFDLDMFDSHLIPTPQLFVTLFATIPPLTTLFCFPILKTAASGQADSLSHRVIGTTLDSCLDKDEQIKTMMSNHFPEVNKQLAARAPHRVFALTAHKT